MGSILHLHSITQPQLSDPVCVRGRSIILASMRRDGGEAHGPPGGKAWGRPADLCHPGQAAGNHLHWDSKWEYSRLSCSGREGWDRGPRNPEQVRQLFRNTFRYLLHGHIGGVMYLASTRLGGHPGQCGDGQGGQGVEDSQRTAVSNQVGQSK